LRGSNEEITAEFALNLGEGSSQVCRIEILVTEEAIAEVSGLPQNGQRWFLRRTALPEFLGAFFTGRRRHSAKGSGI